MVRLGVSQCISVNGADLLTVIARIFSAIVAEHLLRISAIVAEYLFRISAIVAESKEK